MENLLRRHRTIWQDNIRMGSKETGVGIVDWIRVAECRVPLWGIVNTVMNLVFHEMWRIH
jgi:hypothetical protein